MRALERGCFALKHWMLLCAILFSSCASPAMLRMESIAKPSASGDFEGAVSNIEKNKKKLYNSEDEFLFEFDAGLLLHYAQEFKESAKHLAAAENILDELYTRSISNEAAALLTNDNARPYRSYPFEEQWMHQTQIANYLAMGNSEGAGVEARRALLAIQRLEEKEAKLNESCALQYMIALAFEAQSMEDDARIAYERALKCFGEGAPALAAKPPSSEQEIVVIGYAGLSPMLGENKFWGTYARDGALILYYKDASGRRQSMSLFALGLGGPGFTGQTTTIQIAIPKLVDRPSQTAAFLASANGAQAKTQTFLNTRRALQADLDNAQSSILIRTAGRVIARTFAASKAKGAMRTGNGLADLLLNVGTDLATGALEEADLRLGAAMPLALQIARIPAEPGAASVVIETLDAAGRKTGSFAEQSVKVKKGKSAFIIAPALR